jgi:hypothetical protein
VPWPDDLPEGLAWLLREPRAKTLYWPWLEQHLAEFAELEPLYDDARTLIAINAYAADGRFLASVRREHGDDLNTMLDRLVKSHRVSGPHNSDYAQLPATGGRAVSADPLSGRLRARGEAIRTRESLVPGCSAGPRRIGDPAPPNSANWMFRYRRGGTLLVSERLCGAHCYRAVLIDLNHVPSEAAAMEPPPEALVCFGDDRVGVGTSLDREALHDLLL